MSAVRRALFASAVLAASGWLAAPRALDGQIAPPPVLRALEGSWEGSGTLLGRPGAFTMRWQLGTEGFMRLSFTNAFVSEAGVATPVLSSEATYLVRGNTATGVWIDTRPQQITLEATLTDSTIVTRWTAPAEEGRTEYIVRGTGSVVVRDYVIAAGEERLFAEATYTRPVGGAPR